MKATACIRAVASANGTRVTDLRCEPPLVMRETPDALYLVGAAGGPIGGDELSLHVGVDAGAHLRVRSAAATLAQPGPSGQPSRTSTTFEVGAGACLAWEPEPLVSVGGSHHFVDTTITLHVDAQLWFVEEIVLGRYAEDPGRITTRVRINRGGRSLIAHDLDLGPGAAAWDGPAVIGSARAVRTELIVGPHAAGQATVRSEETARAAVFPIAPGAAMVVALGANLTEARRIASAMRS